MARPKDLRNKRQIRTTITLVEGEDDDLIQIFANITTGIPTLIKTLMRSGAKSFVPNLDSLDDANDDLMAAMDDFFI